MRASAAAVALCCIVVACREQGESPSTDTGAQAAGCYRSDGPILTRLASAAQETATIGWLRLDEPLNQGGGPAQLVETSGASLGARWSRRGDTLVVDGANDFIRITARLLGVDGVLRGEAHISSDAQLERAPNGDLVAAERQWRLVAEPAACGNAPRPWSPIEQTTLDPARLRKGDTVGPFRADSVAVIWAEAVGEWTGSVTLVGRVWLRGATVRHPDYPGVKAACFEAEPVSAQQLPRWPNDERRPWFCFENDSVARRMLGAPDSLGPAEVLIERFTTVRAFTDAVNSARIAAANQLKRQH